MDPSKLDAKDSAMIALLPTSTYWCRQDLPHMTLVYAGEISKLSATDFNELAKDAASIAMLSRPLNLRVLGVDVFGDTEKVDVLKLEASSELLAMRRQVERWNASEFPFNPHSTIGPTGVSILMNTLPEYLIFDRVAVAWGNDLLPFFMNKR